MLWCRKAPVNLNWLTRGVLLTLPALRPMIPKNQQGLDGSINALQRTASVDCGFNRGLHGWLSLSLGRSAAAHAMSKSTHNHLTKCLAVTLDVQSAILIGPQDGRITPEGSSFSVVRAARPCWLAAAHRAGGRRMESVCSYSAASTMTGGRPVYSSPCLPAVQPPKI